MQRVSRITVFPIKSLDGTEVSAVRVLPSGALENDRRFALVDDRGNLINGKRCPELLRIRAEYDETLHRVTLRLREEEQTFSLEYEREELARWCGYQLGVDCSLQENLASGFPDDRESLGPTLISSGTLETVCNWFPPLDVGETRRRFRTNLEVAAAAPFWEDQLLGSANPTHQFSIGTTGWWADKVCQRCAVPSRDSRTGEVIEKFAKRFGEMREQTLPSEASRDLFDHFYRLAINTRLAAIDGDGFIHVGDNVTPRGGMQS